MKTYLVGSYGQHNGGDDAFVEVALWGLGKFCKSSTITATSSIPLLTQHGVVRSEVTKRYIKGQHFVQRYFNTRNLNRILYVGGGIHTYGEVLRTQRKILERNPNAICAAIGVSVGPFRDQLSITECKRLLEKFEFVGARGRASYERLRQIDVQTRYELTFDVAVLLREMLGDSYFQNTREDKSVGVSLCFTYDRYFQPNSIIDEQRIEIVACILNDLIQRGECGSVHLIDFCSHDHYGDFEIHERLKAKLLSRVPIFHERYDDDPVALLKRVMRVECMIAMRLHAAIFSYTAGIPCLFFPYQDKCLEWADMAGLPADDVLDLTNGDGQVFSDRLRILLRSDKTNASRPLPEAINLALRNWNVLSELGF